MVLTISGCETACPDSTALELDLVPTQLGMQRPAYYELQGCDEVTWDFGDGSAPVTAPAGTANVTHTWSVPGNYMVTATVKNALGIMTYTSGPRVFASDPAKLSWPRLPNISEGAGTLSIPVRRTGNLSRTVSARLVVNPTAAFLEPALAKAEYPLVFAPGETEHVITLPLHDNHLFDGPRDMGWQVLIGYEQGGVITENGSLTILDNEVQPNLWCDDLSVKEGDRGKTRVAVSCRLSAPLSFHVQLDAWLMEGTATKGDFYEYIDYYTTAGKIAPGKLTGQILLDVLGDTQIEPEEQFKVFLKDLSWNWYGYKDHSSTLTILNDDAALTADRRVVEVGEPIVFTLVLGEQYDVPTEILLRSSDPSSVAVPESVTVTPGAHTVTFSAETLGPGASSVTAMLGTRTLSVDVVVERPAALIVTHRELTLANGTTSSVGVTLSPAQTVPVVVRLTADARIVSVPAQVTIPPGGSATFEARATGVGATAIGVTTDLGAITGSSVLVDVVAAKRRRSAR